MSLPTNTFSAPISWLEIEMRVEIPAVRWPLMALLSLCALSAGLLLLGSIKQPRTALIAAVGLGLSIAVAVTLELPNSDVLTAVPAAHTAAQLLFTARNLGLAVVAGSLLLAIYALVPRRSGQGWRENWREALGAGLGLGIGAATAWAQVAPIAQLKRDLLEVGPLPGPTFRMVVDAQVGLPVERLPSVIHHLINDSKPQNYNPNWQLERPQAIVPTELGAHSVKVRYALGPVELLVPVLTAGIADRGPRAWPLEVGDELHLRTSGGGKESYRVLRTEVVNGFKLFVTEEKIDDTIKTAYLVRKDGGLYRVKPNENDNDGNLSVDDPFLIEPAPGQCELGGLKCPCNPRLVSCSWRSEGTDAGKMAAMMLGVMTLGASTIGDNPLGKTTSGEVFVVSHTGPGAPKP